jgi:hypothetical protein
MPLLLGEIDWNSLFADPGLLVVVAVWIIVGGVVLGAIIAVQWRKVEQTRAEARLKERMVERGFTADEIVKVTDAGAGHGGARKAAGRVDKAAGNFCCPAPLKG